MNAGVLIVIAILLIIFCYFCTSMYQKELYQTLYPHKILIVIITSSKRIHRWDLEKKVWKKYFYLGKKYNIDCVFTECKEEFTYKAVCNESYVPGIYQKTLQTMKAYDDYDYYIRTNLSTFFNFEYLCEFLQKYFTLDYPLYGGHCFSWGVSGTGIVMNQKARDILVQYGFHDKFYKDLKTPDDVLISSVLNTKRVKKICPPYLYVWCKKFTHSINYKMYNYFRYPAIRLRLDHQTLRYKNITSFLLREIYGIV